MQEELGLNVYDLGARNYDPSIGRFFNYDPLAEKYAFQSAYAISINNPVFHIDINGEGVDSDYSFNKQTGEVKLVKQTNDATDRIVKTKSNGEVRTYSNRDPKVELGGIAKGILEDGRNLKTKNYAVDVGGVDKPTLTDVENSLTELSNLIGKELSGAYLSDKENSGISKVYLSKYSENTELKSETDFSTLLDTPALNNMFKNTHFHIHPYNTSDQYGREEIEKASENDKIYRNNNKAYFKNFIILSKTESFPRMLFKKNYTND